MIRIIFLIASLIYRCMSKKYVLLPYDSELCKFESRGIHNYYEFTINQQININTDDNITEILSVSKLSSFTRFQIDSENYKYFLCRILVKPMGRSLDNHGVMGYYSFWNIRIRITRLFDKPNCNDYLLLQFRHQDNLVTTLEGHSDYIVNVTCRDSLPIIVPSQQRKVYITYFSSDQTNRGGYAINVTSFIYFKGDFTIKYQQDMCRRQDGFWCANTTACIFRDMKCDGYDSCFDGGTDEDDCTISGNFSVPTIRPKLSSGFIDYLPWCAVGILPLILLLALICICSQHRSEVYFDEEEDNLDVEKSHDGDDMWSSVDGLDKEDNNDDDDNGDDGGVERDDQPSEWTAKNVHDDGSICLVPLTLHESTTKADISTSHTFQSINRDYEDIDQPGELPTVNNNTSHRGERTDIEPRSQNIMSMSQMTDDDYEDHLEDVGSLLRKVDKSRIPEEVRLTGNRPSTSGISTTSTDQVAVTGSLLPPESQVDYRSDYIVV